MCAYSTFSLDFVVRKAHIDCMETGQRPKGWRDKMTTTLAQLVAEYDANGFFYMDSGNGSAWGEAGEMMDYDDDAAAQYGHIEMTEISGHKAGNGQDLEWISDWIEGENGYRFRVGF